MSWLALVLIAATGPTEPAEAWPMPRWERAEPTELGLDRARLEQARDYALPGGGSGQIIRGGKLVLAWGDPDRRYDLKSSTKSIGVTALGLALRDGKLQLEDRALRHYPGLGVPPEDNARTGWLDQITIRRLATQTAGFEKPGGFGRLLFRPGTRWHYSDGGPNWLADCLTRAYGRDLDGLLSERVFAPLGIAPEDLAWRRNSSRPKPPGCSNKAVCVASWRIVIRSSQPARALSSCGTPRPGWCRRARSSRLGGRRGSALASARKSSPVKASPVR